MPTLLAAPDKFRGTITAAQAAEAIATAGAARGWDVRRVPLSDGGEGFLDALGVLGGRVGERRWRALSAQRSPPNGSTSAGWPSSRWPRHRV